MVYAQRIHAFSPNPAARDDQHHPRFAGDDMRTTKNHSSAATGDEIRPDPAGSMAPVGAIDHMRSPLFLPPLPPCSLQTAASQTGKSIWRSGIVNVESATQHVNGTWRYRAAIAVIGRRQRALRGSGFCRARTSSNTTLSSRQQTYPDAGLQFCRREKR